jgi:hypothetical protein
MLYAGAVLIEGILMWLLVAGISGWTIGLTAVLGVVLLLTLDWALDQRASRPSE